MSEIFSTGARILIGAQRWIMFACGALVILGLFVQVILRYIFESTLLGLNELILIPTLWMYFIGASFASAEGTHISANVLQVYLRNETSKAVLRVVVAAFSLVVGGILSWWSCLYIAHSIERGGTTTVFHIPLLISQAAVLVGFFLMLFYTVISATVAVRDVRAAAQGLPLPSESHNLATGRDVADATLTDERGI